MRRMQLSIGDNVMEYIELKAKDMGIAKSAFIALCVDQYRRQEESISMTNQFQEILAQVATMSEEEKKALSESNQP